MQITEGATLTGGSTVTYTATGFTPGSGVFVGPDHTHLTPCDPCHEWEQSRPWHPTRVRAGWGPDLVLRT